jgi:PAS domain S-box-containing protein
MKKSRREAQDAVGLRDRAEEVLRDMPGGLDADQRNRAEEMGRLVHELQVHQIELELQNEELERARADLETALGRYTDLYDFAPVGYLTLGPEGEIREANLTGSRLLGLERSQLIGGRFGLHVSEASRPAFNTLLEQVFQGGAKKACDVALRAENDGLPTSSRWVRIEAVVSDSQPECRAIVIDITERRRLEEILQFRIALMDYAETHSFDELIQKTIAKIGTMTGSSAGFYHVVGPDQMKLEFQVRLARSAGESSAWMRQGPHFGEDAAGVPMESLRDGRPVIRNDVSLRPHGMRPPDREPAIREMAVPILRVGRVVAVVGVSNKPSDYTDRDIELVSFLADVAWAIIDRKRTDEALVESELRSREAANALRKEDRNKDRFLAMLSHELRNPLAPIRNCLYVLDHAQAGDKQAKLAMAIIHRQVGHMTRLIDDLLDVTRISRGKVHLQRQPLDLRDVVFRAVEDHRPAFGVRGVDLNVTVPEEAVPVNGDAVRLAQVIGNLLHNAAKFTPRGGETLLTLEIDTDNTEAVLRVRDTGAGLAADMLPRVFDEFTQAEGALDRNPGGLGLGLALVRGLAILHGGSVSARSDGLGMGTEFTIRLPVGSGPFDVPAESRALPVRSPRRVLVIEDNVDTAESLRHALELNGHTVDVAYDGPDGIRKAREFKPEVVVCDIGLPELDGYAVARALRADSTLRTAYLVALTGRALPEDKARARDAGFDRHLAKPPDLEALEIAIAGAPAADLCDAGPTPIP